MKKIIHISIIIALLIFTVACNDYDYSVDYENIDCSECYKEKPAYADLIITFSDDIQDTVLFTVYAGPVDESRIECEGWATASPLYLPAPTDQFYSVKAEYHCNGNCIYAIDAETLNTHFITNYCDEDCYIISDGEYDVRLKEQYEDF